MLYLILSWLKLICWPNYFSVCVARQKSLSSFSIFCWRWDIGFLCFRLWSSSWCWCCMRVDLRLKLKKLLDCLASDAYLYFCLHSAELNVFVYSLMQLFTNEWRGQSKRKRINASRIRTVPKLSKWISNQLLIQSLRQRKLMSHLQQKILKEDNDFCLATQTEK